MNERDGGGELHDQTNNYYERHPNGMCRTGVEDSAGMLNYSKDFSVIS